jgi:hypothetical protein
MIGIIVQELVYSFLLINIYKILNNRILKILEMLVSEEQNCFRKGALVCRIVCIKDQMIE